MRIAILFLVIVGCAGPVVPVGDAAPVWSFGDAGTCQTCARASCTPDAGTGATCPRGSLPEYCEAPMCIGMAFCQDDRTQPARPIVCVPQPG